MASSMMPAQAAQAAQGFICKVASCQRLQFFRGDVEMEEKEFFGTATGGLCASALRWLLLFDFQGRANAQ